MNLDPLTWPLKWRRLFLLTLPISGPIYLFVLTLLLIGAAIFIILLGGFIWTLQMWGVSEQKRRKN